MIVRLLKLVSLAVQSGGGAVGSIPVQPDPPADDREFSDEFSDEFA